MLELVLEKELLEVIKILIYAEGQKYPIEM